MPMDVNTWAYVYITPWFAHQMEEKMSELMLSRQLHIKNEPSLLIKIIFLPFAAFVKKGGFPL